MAALRGSEQIVQRLLDHGADVNVQNEFLGDAPLEVAAALGHVEVVRRLLAAGANVTIRTEYGSTPLHMAALSERADVAALLLDYGADPNARTPDVPRLCTWPPRTARYTPTASAKRT
jgi:ankyrin repeat protein